MTAENKQFTGFFYFSEEEFPYERGGAHSYITCHCREYLDSDRHGSVEAGNHNEALIKSFHGSYHLHVVDLPESVYAQICQLYVGVDAIYPHSVGVCGALK